MKKFGDCLKEIRLSRKMSQDELASLLNTSKQVVSKYETNQRTPKVTIANEYAKVLNVPLSVLLGHEEDLDIYEEPPYPKNILPIETRKIPLLGTVAAGVPLLADEQFEAYIECGARLQADFALRVQGDSMINARINDGDIVFIRKQEMVNNGEIAVVAIGDEATLKRFYKYGKHLILHFENPIYKDIEIDLDESSDVRVLGKAIAFQSDIK